MSDLVVTGDFVHPVTQEQFDQSEIADSVASYLVKSVSTFDLTALAKGLL